MDVELVRKSRFAAKPYLENKSILYKTLEQNNPKCNTYLIVPMDEIDAVELVQADLDLECGKYLQAHLLSRIHDKMSVKRYTRSSPWQRP